MRRYLFWSALAMALTSAVSVAGSEAPLSVAGFVLGRPIEEFADRLNMETVIPLRYMESIQEVEIKSTPGIKSGLIAFGTCRKPGFVVRIKLKYADGSGQFFEELLNRFKSQFGDSAEYQGDPFRVFISWKWSFTDSRNNRISLTLQHNEMDDDEKIGNAVKLTLHNLLEEDLHCSEQKQADGGERLRRRRSPDSPAGGPRWDLFIPK
jgi:hypothetical protein